MARVTVEPDGGHARSAGARDVRRQGVADVPGLRRRYLPAKVPGDDPLGLNRQVLLAVEESDLLLLVVDGKQGLLPADEEVWSRFSATPDEVMAYYEGLVRAYREAGGGRLVDELDRIVRGIRREMGY